MIFPLPLKLKASGKHFLNLKKWVSNFYLFHSTIVFFIAFGILLIYFCTQKMRKKYFKNSKAVNKRYFLNWKLNTLLHNRYDKNEDYSFFMAHGADDSKEAAMTEVIKKNVVKHQIEERALKFENQKMNEITNDKILRDKNRKYNLYGFQTPSHFTSSTHPSIDKISSQTPPILYKTFAVLLLIFHFLFWFVYCFFFSTFIVFIIIFCVLQPIINHEALKIFIQKSSTSLTTSFEPFNLHQISSHFFVANSLTTSCDNQLDDRLKHLPNFSQPRQHTHFLSKEINSQKKFIIINISDYFHKLSNLLKYKSLLLVYNLTLHAPSHYQHNIKTLVASNWLSLPSHLIKYTKTIDYENTLGDLLHVEELNDVKNWIQKFVQKLVVYFNLH